MRTLPLLCLLAATSTAAADPVAAPGTDGWCAGFGTTTEGAFLYPDGSEALLFRAGIEGETGCYAWLSYVPNWGLEPGASLGSAEDRGDRQVIVFSNGVEVHLLNAGGAEHHRQGNVTPGVTR